VTRLLLMLRNPWGGRHCGSDPVGYFRDQLHDALPRHRHLMILPQPLRVSPGARVNEDTST